MMLYYIVFFHMNGSFRTGVAEDRKYTLPIISSIWNYVLEAPNPFILVQ